MRNYNILLNESNTLILIINEFRIMIYTSKNLIKEFHVNYSSKLKVDILSSKRKRVNRRKWAQLVFSYFLNEEVKADSSLNNIWTKNDWLSFIYSS